MKLIKRLFSTRKNNVVEDSKRNNSSHNKQDGDAWKYTEGTAHEVAVKLYNDILFMDSTEKLIFQSRRVPGYEFVVIKRPVEDSEM